MKTDIQGKKPVLVTGSTGYVGGKFMESGYRMIMDASEFRIWETVSQIGGDTGWYSSKFLWAFRGLIDRLVGGAGLRRGRRDPQELRPGATVDFFRVLDVQKFHRLHLIAEMKFPGDATLEFRIQALKDGTTELQQVSRYLPHGLPGLIYWYALYPVHQWVFKDMMKAIARAVNRPVIKGPDCFPTA